MITQKELAIELMTKLDIYKPYINKFKSKAQVVCLFENFGGFYIAESQNPKLFKKIKDFERTTGSMVYAVTHEFFEFGECYDLLIVPDFTKYDESEVEYEIETMRDDVADGYVFAYVWNVDDDWCSEYGTIAVKSFGGGIKRIG
jgi:hypothetical protein